MKNSFWTIKKFSWLLFIIVGLLFSMLTIYVVSYLLPAPELTTERNTIIYDDQGVYIGEERGLESRYWIPLEEIPEVIREALVLTEDRHFFTHHGFDFPRILSAFGKNIKHRSLKEGASTITQQYTRNLFLSHEKTWNRKIKEAFYSLRIESHYEKEEILEGYLNTVYFGHGAYGIEAASRFFFNKKVADLTLAEGAMLVGIPKGPSYYSPLKDEGRAKARQGLILGLLKKAEVISFEEYQNALEEDLQYIGESKGKRKSFSPYFQDEVVKEAAQILQKDLGEIKTGGYHIYTTLHSREQKSLEDIIVNVIPKDKSLQTGAISMDVQTGAIRSLIGGRDYDESPFNRATQASRMAGSTFKPILYYAALEKNFTAATKLRSEATSFTIQDEIYQPKNYNNYYGNKPITLAQAVALSDNIYAVKTHLFLGMEDLVKTGELLGFSNLEELASLALGATNVSPKELARAYNQFANGGKKQIGYTIERIESQEGQVLYERENSQEQILNKESAFLLTHLLTGMFDPALNDYMKVTGSTIAEELTREYAGKSGSTDYDSWMVGYSPSVTTAIWIGYDEQKKLHSPIEYGYAKEIWAKYMEEIHKEDDELTFTPPAGLVKVRIDPASGLVATENCPTSREMYFRKGTEPLLSCNLHEGDRKQGDDSPEEKGDRRGFLKRLFDFIFP